MEDITPAARATICQLQAQLDAQHLLLKALVTYAVVRDGPESTQRIVDIANVFLGLYLRPAADTEDAELRELAERMATQTAEYVRDFWLSMKRQGDELNELRRRQQH